MVLAHDGKSSCRIVTPQKATPQEGYAAKELSSFLERISGATLPIVTDEGPLGDSDILVGAVRQLSDIAPDIGVGELGQETSVLHQVGNHLVIVGGEPRGTLYGVYALLEEHLGCRFFAVDETRVPSLDTVELKGLDETISPRLEYREPFYTEAFDGDFAARSRMNSNRALLEERHGGKIVYGSFVHTFYPLISPEEFFDDHPEYFSFSREKAERFQERGQLCLTNPDVLAITIERVRGWCLRNPDIRIVSVSQNDWHGACECDNCAAIDEAEESQMGTMLQFVNQVADAIRDDLPHVAVDTLAYQYTRKPPKTLIPRDNVIIRLCSIECCFSHTLDSDCGDNVAFADDIRGWSKICQRVYIWDYVTNFGHYVQPFPNFKVLASNIRFFADHGVKGIFEEGNYATGGGGELAPLRSYVLSKLLWDPDSDPEIATKEFVEQYYGTASNTVMEYLDLLHADVDDPDKHLHIFDRPDVLFLTDGFVAEALQLLEGALANITNEATAQRMEMVIAPLIYL
ncbi:MAG: DUF4838 domain-containing protein, partial [Candidatus Latescibacteria bacterium]|nr:DUF4838 domain-containing protein [Candidatus Latescibacterota bacterium]